MRSSFQVAHGLVVVAGLLGVANAQAYFGPTADQQGYPTCSAYPVKYLGCFTITGPQLALAFPFTPLPYTPPPTIQASSNPGFNPSTPYDSTITPSDCTRVCRNFGYKYTSIFNNQCRCGQQLPAAVVGATPNAGACGIACGGDFTQTCGGATAADFYVDPSFADNIASPPATTVASAYQYLGCYRITSGFPNQDSARLDQNTLNSGLFTTAADCATRCASLGYPLVYASRR
jgi:hypothetical protein